MPNPYLVPCLVKLRSEFNVEYPNRDKGADGWIADSRHSSTSDHQPNAQGAVRALDVDADLHKPNSGMRQVCAFITSRLQSGTEDRSEYVIFNRTIWSRIRGYEPIPYTGTDPHTGHIHISARHDGHGWNDMRSWGIESSLAPKPPAPPADWTETTIMGLPTVSRGATGTPVRTLQGLLIARGEKVTVDGNFGPDTETATKAMQHKFGAEHIDGVWGPETWSIGLLARDVR